MAMRFQWRIECLSSFHDGIGFSLEFRRFLDARQRIDWMVFLLIGFFGSYNRLGCKYRMGYQMRGLDQNGAQKNASLSMQATATCQSRLPTNVPYTNYHACIHQRLMSKKSGYVSFRFTGCSISSQAPLSSLADWLRDFCQPHRP